MMQKRLHILFLFFAISLPLHAQQKDSIGTQNVTITKSYTPALSKTYKIKENPQIKDTIGLEKNAIRYTIFSVPVASTFVPVTGVPLKLQPTDKEVLYNTYISLGLGNYGTALLDMYTSHALDKEKTIDITLQHHSSQGGIKNISLDDSFYRTNLQANYRKKSRTLSWKTGGEFQHQLYHWYSRYDDTIFNESTLNSIEEQQQYYNAYLHTTLSLDDSFFKEGTLSIRRFWDLFGSAEYHGIATPSIEFPIAEQRINTTLTIDYLNGSFDRNYTTNTPLRYNNLLASIKPSLIILKDNFNLNIGASAAYTTSYDTDRKKIFVYPQVTALYAIIKDDLITYAGVKGGLTQNAFHHIVTQNPFVSPTLNSIPTDMPYYAYLGLKGKWTPHIHYHLKGAYRSENNKPLFILNSIANSGNNQGYTYGNSFQVLYDTVRTLSVFGTLHLGITSGFHMDFQAEFFDYQTEEQPEAWNLPTIKSTLEAQYDINTHWQARMSLFFTGRRKDLLSGEGFPESQPISGDHYIDANAKLNYQFNKRFSAFLHLNNILNTSYGRWATYPVQGFQALAGASYQFDL